MRYKSIKKVENQCYQNVNNQFRKSYRKQVDIFSFILRKFAG